MVRRGWGDRERTGEPGERGRGQENLEGGTRGLTGALRGGGGAGKESKTIGGQVKARIVGWRNKRNAC